MNLQGKYPTTPDEFLRWNEGREGKREFVRGRVVEMMINVTRNHWRLCNRLERQIAAQLGDDEFDVGTTDFGVRTPDGVRFPDLIVEAAAENGKALATAAPLVLAEILSPSSIADDFGSKARDYLGIETLEHYLVISQDEFRVWRWSRSAENEWLQPTVVEAHAFDLEIAGRTVVIDMVALYAGIAKPPMAF